jgi:magnesium transporter
MSALENQETPNHASRALQLLEDSRSDSTKKEELIGFLNELHPVELDAMIGSVEEEQQKDLVRHITSLDQLSEVTAYADENLRKRIALLVDDSRLAAVVRRQEIDDAANILRGIPRRRQLSVIKRLSPKMVKDLTTLMAYSQDTAGAIMTTLFIAQSKDVTASQALSNIQSQLQSGELDPDTDVTYLYITNSIGHLEGVISLRRLLASPNDAKLSELMTSPVITVAPDDDQEKVAELIADYNFSSIPVVSTDDGKIMGVVTMDDVIDIIEEEHTEDLLKLAGTEESDLIGTSTKEAIKSRMPWLFASWCGGMLGMFLLKNFSTTLEKYVALAFFMPIVFGMAGNVGTQSSTISVRGIAIRELSSFNFLSRLRKEVSVGALLGLIFGILLALMAYFFFENPRLSFTVGFSIIVTMTSSATLGNILPIFFKKLGFDPAVASGPFVTTTTDILSIVIYFSVATLLFN